MIFFIVDLSLFIFGTMGIIHKRVLSSEKWTIKESESEPNWRIFQIRYVVLDCC